MFYVNEEEDCEIYVPQEDPYFRTDWRGRRQHYIPRGTRVRHIFPQMYSTRGQPDNMKQKSSVRVIYDNPDPPVTQKPSNRGKFKLRGKNISPRTKQINNSTIQSDKEIKFCEKSSESKTSHEHAEIHAKEPKSVGYISQFPDKTEPNFCKLSGMFNAQIPCSSQYPPSSIKHPPYIPDFNNHLFHVPSNISSTISSHKFAYNSYRPNFPMQCPNIPVNRFQLPGLGSKFYSNRPNFLSSNYRYEGPKIVPKVSDCLDSSEIVQSNVEVIPLHRKSPKIVSQPTAHTSNQTKITPKVKTASNEPKISLSAKKISSKKSKITPRGSSTSSNETGPHQVLDQVSTNVVGDRVQVKNNKKEKKTKVDIAELIIKAHAIGIIEQKISHKIPVKEDLFKNTESAESSVNVIVNTRTLTADQRQQKGRREWERQLQERIEIEHKDNKNLERFVGYYGVAVSKNIADDDDSLIFFGHKVTGAERARGGCRRGAWTSNKGGHSQRQIYEFKFAKERVKRSYRV